jgi:hypothetical protein
LIPAPPTTTPAAAASRDAAAGSGAAPPPPLRGLRYALGSQDFPCPCFASGELVISSSSCNAGGNSSLPCVLVVGSPGRSRGAWRACQVPPACVRGKRWFYLLFFLLRGASCCSRHSVRRSASESRLSPDSAQALLVKVAMSAEKNLRFDFFAMTPLRFPARS